MRKIFFEVGTGYSGMEAYELLEVENDITDSQLDEMAYNLSLDNACTYGEVVHEFELDDEDDELEPGRSLFLESELIYHWEEYNPEKHDGYL